MEILLGFTWAVGLLFLVFGDDRGAKLLGAGLMVFALTVYALWFGLLVKLPNPLI